MDFTPLECTELDQNKQGKQYIIICLDYVWPLTMSQPFGRTKFALAWRTTTLSSHSRLLEYAFESLSLLYVQPALMLWLLLRFSNLLFAFFWLNRQELKILNDISITLGHFFVEKTKYVPSIWKLWPFHENTESAVELETGNLVWKK